MDSRIQTACLLVLAGFAVAASLYFLRPVMVPFVLALFIALGLTTVIDLLQRRMSLPRWAALTLATVLGIGFLAGIGGLVAASVRSLTADADLYTQRVQELVKLASEHLPEEVRITLAGEGDESFLAKVPEKAAGDLLLGTTDAIIGVASQGVLVLIFVAFLILGGGSRSTRAIGAWGEIESKVKKYIVAKAGISALVGVLVGLTYLLLGVPLALVFGLFAFLLNFIPNVGSFVAVLLPLPVIVMSPEISLVEAILALVVPVVINVLIGNVLEPKILGDTLRLHPITILLALILWGVLWGVAGMFLAVPLTSALAILLDKLEPTRPIARMMAGDLSGMIEEVDPKAEPG